nr:beta-ketoacyl synthase N-terminal-like domain-containing protein [Bacillus velezensis]
MGAHRKRGSLYYRNSGDRWDWRRYAGDENDTSLRWGGFIDGVGEFDPLFFGISPKEASQMGPEQFLLLMHTWKAMEDAV